jgi:predicted nucleotidyltransferase
VGSAHDEVLAFYLFGSRAAGNARPDSDFDLGVLYDTPQPLATTLALEDELEHALATAVDLVDAARAKPYLALDIVRGERIFCRDADETDRFDLYVLRRAGDLLPHERARRSMLLQPSSG